MDLVLAMFIMLFCGLLQNWLSRLESHQHLRINRPACYYYTTRQCGWQPPGGLARPSDFALMGFWVLRARTSLKTDLLFWRQLPGIRGHAGANPRHPHGPVKDTRYPGSL